MPSSQVFLIQHFLRAGKPLVVVVVDLEGREREVFNFLKLKDNKLFQNLNFAMRNNVVKDFEINKFTNMWT